MYNNWPEEYPDPSWFVNDRLGLFIHFGLYSVAGRHEWLMTTEKISSQEYEKYFDQFNPELMDMKQLARTAKKNGMKYAVLTTRHHEGFSLFDTDYSEYKISKTKYNKDLVKEFVDAFRSEGIKIGFYYSLIDWHHEHFTIDGLHPQRDVVSIRETNTDRDMNQYRSFMKNQLTELLTNYGKIDYLFFDFSYGHQDYGWSKGKGKEDWRSEELLEHVLSLQPQLLVNDRLDIPVGISTPEQYLPDEPIVKDGHPVLWEVCLAMKDTWGYDRDARNWKSSEMLIKTLIHTVSIGGNLLLNVGPDGKGLLDPREAERLEDLGEWMRLNNRSIYGAGPSEFETPKDCRYTQVGKHLFLHVFSWPLRHIHLKGLAGKIRHIQFLHDHSEVSWRGYDPHEVITTTETRIDKDTVIVELPVEQPPLTVPVLEILLK